MAMQLLRTAEVSPAPGDRVFRYSPLGALLMALGCIGVVIALVLFAWQGRSSEAHYIVYYVAGVFLLALLLMREFILARLLSSNWLVRASSDGLLIRFRSYLNYRLPAADLTVVFIPYTDIRSARLVRNRTKIPGEDGHTEKTGRFVELELAGDLAPLAKALTVEYAMPALREKRWYGSAATLYRHYPVRMVSSHFLEVEWSVTPDAASFLDFLRPCTTIAPPIEVSEDLASALNLSSEEQEKRLRELDRRGETLAAVYLATKFYGYGLTEARSFVEGLRLRP